MKFPVLASVIIFVLVIARIVKKNSKSVVQSEKSFWERERLANSVRRKSLDTLSYIKIPFESLPMQTFTEDERVADCLSTLEALADQPIVNLTGYTNTDLKLEYGTANITHLTECDQNYTLLARTLQQWADSLYNAGFLYEARQVMEYALQTDTDVSRSYYLLAEIYHDRGEDALIADLIARADALHSPHKKVIVRKLQESYPSYGLPRSS